MRWYGSEVINARRKFAEISRDSLSVPGRVIDGALSRTLSFSKGFWVERRRRKSRRKISAVKRYWVSRDGINIQPHRRFIISAQDQPHLLPHALEKEEPNIILKGSAIK